MLRITGDNGATSYKICTWCRSRGSCAKLVKAFPDPPGEAPEMAREAALMASSRTLHRSESDSPGGTFARTGISGEQTSSPVTNYAKAPFSHAETQLSRSSGRKLWPSAPLSITSRLASSNRVGGPSMPWCG
jgi:hypothetical protein